MWAGLACLCLCILPRLGHGFNLASALNASNVVPEPRSFASLSGLGNDSVIYLYGGFSHSRNAWLKETWKLQLGEPHPQWTKFSSVLEGPLQHASLVNLDGVVLLIGGRNQKTGQISDQLYRFNATEGAWVNAKVQGGAAPLLYWHTAVSYDVGGSPRVLLCGGLSETTNATVDDVYELSYDNTSTEYIFTKLPPMPQPLFGHSLAVGVNSTVYVSGGLTGSFGVLPTHALPPKLAQLMNATGESSGSNVSASGRVFEFSRSLTLNGSWTELGNAARPSAFHASWVDGDALYMHGGVQGRAENASDAPYGLQIVNISSAAGPLNFSMLTKAYEALTRWKNVQPGNVSGAAVWVNGSSAASLQARVWMFGGWTTPQPLPVWTDSYLSPQDSSLFWRLNNSDAGWLAPLQGGMAPRGAPGLMAVPMTVGGARKMLVLGGRAAKGWTGAMVGNTALTYDRDILLNDLPLPPLNEPLDSARAYQLYDMWLIDQVTGEREMVWNFACPAWGSWQCPTAVGRLWDRRLLESYVAGADPGGSATAVYLQAEEMAATKGSNVAKLQPGIWKLELSVISLNATDGSFNATVANWTSLLPVRATSAPTGVESCYPRVLYGAAHLVSTLSNISYIALHGGLVSSDHSLWDTVSSSVCLLELDNITRWLFQPDFGYMAPQARYRHACASRPGLETYSMTCYGGWDHGRVLEDAWTLTLPGGVSMGAGMETFLGDWSVAHANYSALRPGPRIDHWMLPVRGATRGNAPSSTTLQVAEDDFSPLFLVGGSARVTTDKPAPLPFQPMWLLDSAACADPDSTSNDVSALKPDRRAQVWLSLLPTGTLQEVAAAAANMEPQFTTWALAAAAVVKVKNESLLELWLLLAEASDGAVGDVRAIKAEASSGGCLSTSVRPYCSNLSYSDDAAMQCWSGATLLSPYPSLVLNGTPNSEKLQDSSGGFTLVDPDGAAVPFKGVENHSLSGIRVPPGLKLDDLTLVAFGKPYIYLGNTSAGQNWTLSLPQPYKIRVKLRLSNGTVPSNVAIELRVRGSDGLDRKRNSNPLTLSSGSSICPPVIRSPYTIAPDRCTTDTNGTAEFYVMNTSFMNYPGVVSYVVVFTLRDSGKKYSAKLKSPEEAAKTTAVIENGNINSTLLYGGPDAVYDIVVNSPSVTLNVTFKSPNGTALQMPKRNWTAEIRKLTEMVQVFQFTSQYSAKTLYKLELPPGSYTVEVFDVDAEYDLKALTYFTVQDNESLVVQVDVPVSSVWLNISFAGLAPGSLSGVRPLHVWVRLSVMASKAPYWGESMVDGGNPWALLPGKNYKAEFYFPCPAPCSTQETILQTMNITSPDLDSNGNGNYLQVNRTLPQKLMCGGSQNDQVVTKNERKGMLLLRSVAYISETTCLWRINTGQPMAQFRIMYSGNTSMNGAVRVTSDKPFDILNSSSADKNFTVFVPNVSIEFTSGIDGVMDYFQVSWEGRAITTSMPPQFIMMIAASSAAAGAMLLFLCLWHCVFRPVQMRRQRPASATVDKPQPAALAVVAAAGPLPTVGPVTSLPAPPPSSGPTSHSEPEAAGGEVCSICLSEFEDGERVKHLPCKHFYHVACIDQWLGRDITCPLCKDNVLDALKNLFGPLPPKSSNARHGRVGDEDTMAVGASTAGAGAAAAATAVPDGADVRDLGGGAGRAVSGGGAANGGDLEMVVILPYDPAAPGIDDSGGGDNLTELPGSVTAGNAALGRHPAGPGSPPLDTAGSPASSLTPRVTTSAAAAGAGVMASGPAGPISSSNSRELRPMRRNISADLTADQEGTSSDCDSGNDSEYDTAPHQPRHGSGVTVATAALTAAVSNSASSRVFRTVPSGSGGAVAGGWGNPFALAVLSQSASAATASTGASSYFETAGLAPSPRPVVEHVQRSPYSSSSAHSVGMRRMPSQAAPRLAAPLAGGPTVHRLARAQEAQMAVAAAALSAAAAGVSSGGVSNSAGGSGAGAVVSWRTASSSSVCGSTPPPIPCFDGAASGTEAVLPYRVHNNPLALDSAASRSDVGSPRPTDVAFVPAFPRDQVLGFASTATAVNSPPSALQSRFTVSPAPNAVSVLSGSRAGSQRAAHGGFRPRRLSSAGNMQPRAVPEVSASCDDIIRVVTSDSTPASQQQQQQHHGRETVIGLWGSAGLL
ncbi:hypothetical protein Vretimale_2421 [Volvox reticuliferus]|nr:hypothetical protein Vretimale_2421 [Volvox reticuliferus]